MQIKSWQIAAISALIQLGAYDLEFVFLGIYARIAILIGIMCVLLLYSLRIQKIGAVLSILFGITLGLLSLSSYSMLVIYGGLAAATYIVAGIHYFWKKV